VIRFQDPAANGASSHCTLPLLLFYTTWLLYYPTVIALLHYSTLVTLSLFYVHTRSSFVIFLSYCVISYHALFFQLFSSFMYIWNEMRWRKWLIRRPAWPICSKRLPGCRKEHSAIQLRVTGLSLIEMRRCILRIVVDCIIWLLHQIDLLEPFAIMTFGLS